MENTLNKQKENQKIINQKKENKQSSGQENVNSKVEPSKNISTADIGIMACPLDELKKNKKIDENIKNNSKQEIKFIQKKKITQIENFFKKNMDNFKEQNLISNIKKGLGNQLSDINTQIQSNNIIIPKIQKNLNKYIKSASNEKKIIKYSNEDYEQKKKYKIIKDLKKEQLLLIKRLNKIDENEALLSKEGLMNLNNSSDCITKFDKSIKEQNIKANNNKKNEIIERLKEIEFRMYQLLDKDKDKKNSELTRQEKLKNFDKDYERDKEIIKKRSNEYLKESENSRKKWEDIQKNYNNIIKNRIEEKEKEDQIKSKKLKDEIRKREKAIGEKISEEIKEYEKPPEKNYLKPEKFYSYKIYENKYKLIKQQIIDKKIDERKKKIKSVTSEDLEEFHAKIEEKKEKIRKEKEIKNKDELIKFEKAKNFKPSYIGKFYDISEEEGKTEREMIKIEIEEKREYAKAKKEELLNKIKKTKQPKIDENLKKIRMDKITCLESPKLVVIKDTFKKKLKKQKSQRLNDLTKPIKLPWLEKIKADESYKIFSNSAILEKKLIKRPKTIKFSSSFSDKKKEEEKGKNKNKNKNKENKNAKNIDYLKEMREKKQKTTGQKDNEMYNKIRKLKLEKKLKNNDENIIQNIESVKKEADDLEKKAKMENDFMKLNGGVKNNPETDKKVRGYIIDSIEAKLNILNQMYKDNY